MNKAGACPETDVAAGINFDFTANLVADNLWKAKEEDNAKYERGIHTDTLRCVYHAYATTLTCISLKAIEILQQ